MSSLLFQSQNVPPVSNKVILYPYIFLRNNGGIRIGLCCDEPAPEDDVAVVRFSHPEYPESFDTTVRIRKGMRETTITGSIQENLIWIPTLRLYRDAELRIVSCGTDSYRFGPKRPCPSVTFDLNLGIEMASEEYWYGSISPFEAGSIELEPTNMLFSSTDLSDVESLSGPQSSYSYYNTVKISRAAALAQLSPELNLKSHFGSLIQGVKCRGNMRYTLAADVTRDLLVDDSAEIFSDTTSQLLKVFGAPDLGEYIHAGVSVFTIDIKAENIVINN